MSRRRQGTEEEARERKLKRDREYYQQHRDSMKAKALKKYYEKKPQPAAAEVN